MEAHDVRILDANRLRIDADLFDGDPASRKTVSRIPSLRDDIGAPVLVGEVCLPGLGVPLVLPDDAAPRVDVKAMPHPLIVNVDVETMWILQRLGFADVEDQAATFGTAG